MKKRQPPGDKSGPKRALSYTRLNSLLILRYIQRPAVPFQNEASYGGAGSQTSRRTDETHNDGSADDVVGERWMGTVERNGTTETESRRTRKADRSLAVATCSN